MIEGIYQIGKIIKKGRSTSNMAITPPDRREGKNYKIAKINFDTENEVIEIDLNEEYESEKERKYKFIKLSLSGKQNQFLATFSDARKRLLIMEAGEDKKYGSWLSIEEEILKSNSLASDEVEEFLEQIEKVKSIFYPEGVLDLTKMNGMDEPVPKKFNKFIKSKLGKGEEIIFWTVLINGKEIVHYKFYEDLLNHKILESKRKKGKTKCFICNKEIEGYIDDFARLPLKFFINDKLGFSQNLSDNWEGNFVLCDDCYLSLFAGEKFISSEFKFNIGNLNYIIIPEFLQELPSGFNEEKVISWAALVRDLYNVFEFFDKNELKKKFENYKKYNYLPYFWLNYVFFEQKNQQFKIYSLVKDLPKGRIDFLRERFLEYLDDIFQNLPKFYDYRLRGFGDLYYIVPLRYSSNDHKILEIPKIMELFSRILEGREIDRDFLIFEFWKGTNAKFYRNKSYHIVGNSDNTENEMVRYVLRSHQLFILLKKLNILGGKTMIINDIFISDLPQEFKEYIKEVGFGEEEISLFLLGTIIGDIGSRQARYRSKPILNKINFQGMSITKLKILFNEIYEKMIQEKMLFPDKERIYSLAHKLFDQNIKTWSLKPYENVYYLLSGYAFKTALNIRSGGSNEQ